MAPRVSLRLSRLVHRGRELPALALACVWIFGVLVAPMVHLAAHAALAPHSHEAASDSCHDGHCHDPRASATSDDDQQNDGDHGRDSIAHGHIAALFPAPAFLIPPFVAMGERAHPNELQPPLDGLEAPRSVARGPPTYR